MYDAYKRATATPCRGCTPCRPRCRHPAKNCSPTWATARCVSKGLGGRRHSGHAGAARPAGTTAFWPRETATVCAGERDHHRAAGHQRHGPQQNRDHGSGCHPQKVRHRAQAAHRSEEPDGDTSDNIPGVKGIGEKTAMTLVKNFGTPGHVYDHLDSLPIIKPRQRKIRWLRREDAYQPRWAPSAPMLPYRHSGRGPWADRGQQARAVRLMQELEIRPSSPGSAGRHRSGTGPRYLPGPCPQNLRHHLAAARPAVLGKRARSCSRRPGTPCRTPPCIPLSEEELVSLLDDPRVTLDVFDSAPSTPEPYAGSWGSNIWDGKLAAYLLDACFLTICYSPLPPAYHAKSAFSVRSTPMPVSGRPVRQNEGGDH